MGVERLAVLTSGGDAPGMNAAIRAVVRRAIYAGAEIYGVSRGFAGLLQNDLSRMELGSVADIIHRGGTTLRTARCEEFKSAAGQERALANLHQRGIDGLIVIGGDGSFRGCLALERLGVATVGIPATIDNDIGGTHFSLGFDTAVNTILDAVNKIRDTATAHERTFIMEVMGRDSGFLALAAGVGGGAESILIPEVAFDLDDICQRMMQGYARGKVHSIIMVAEGVQSGHEVAAAIEARTGLECRVTVLGHIQRGGAPTAQDRILGSRMGALAVELLLDGQRGKMVGLEGEGMVVRPLEAGLEPRDINRELYDLAVILAI